MLQMVYVCDLTNQCEFSTGRFLPLLNQQRQKKALRYRFQEDCRLSIAVFLLLRYGFYHEYGIENCPVIKSDGLHKPVLQNFSLSFSFSHCENTVACSLAPFETGVDIEKYTDKIKTVRSMFISPSEAEEIKKCGNSSEISMLTRLWTIKEAYGKFRGTGLNYSLTETDFSGIMHSEEWQQFQNIWFLSYDKKQYDFSICSEKKIEYRQVNASELMAFAEYLLIKRK